MTRRPAGLHTTQLAVVVVLLGLAAAAQAVERFPLPDFPSWYNQPGLDRPAARSAWLEYMDLAVLVAALAAAAYLGLRARSRRGLLVLTILALAYFGFYRRGCVCPIGAIQNVAAGLFNGQAVPLFVLAFFLLPLAAAILFGRTFCAGVCPLGALQDLVLLKPMKLPMWLEHALGLLPWAYLAAAVLLAATDAAFIICQYDPFVGIFRLGGQANMLIFGACVLIVAVFVGRPYCRFACPYGALLRPLARISWRHVTITPEECVNCRLCEDACPFNAIQTPSPQDPDAPRAHGKRLLAALIVLLPVLAVVGGWVASAAHEPIARGHYKVLLAEHVRLLKQMEAAEKLAVRPPLTVGGRTFRVHGALGRGILVATDAASGKELWRSADMDPRMHPAWPPEGLTVRLACDGNAVWAMVKDRQVVDGDPLDVYRIAIFDAATGRLLRAEDHRLDHNLTLAFEGSSRRFGTKAEDVYAEASAARGRIGVGTWLAGGFVGLVAGLKLLQLSVRRKRIEHQIDRARCVSCGRCFRHCPVEHRRLKKLREGKTGD